jgi:hypothetical protein
MVKRCVAKPKRGQAVVQLTEEARLASGHPGEKAEEAPYQ